MLLPDSCLPIPDLRVTIWPRGHHLNPVAASMLNFGTVDGRRQPLWPREGRVPVSEVVPFRKARGRRLRSGAPFRLRVLCQYRTVNCSVGRRRCHHAVLCSLTGNIGCPEYSGPGIHSRFANPASPFIFCFISKCGSIQSLKPSVIRLWSA